MIYVAELLFIVLAFAGCALLERVSRARTAPARHRARQHRRYWHLIALGFRHGGGARWK